MRDLHHIFGGDLMLSATADLLPVAGTERGRQRVLRRLLTNPFDLLVHPDYGAGLPAQIGELRDEVVLGAMVRAQVTREAVVAPDPAPEIATHPVPNGVSVVVRYRDRDTGDAAGIGFDVTR